MEAAVHHACTRVSETLSSASQTIISCLATLCVCVQDGAETGGKAALFADSAADAGKGSAPPDVTAQEPFAVLRS